MDQSVILFIGLARTGRPFYSWADPISYYRSEINGNKWEAKCEQKKKPLLKLQQFYGDFILTIYSSGEREAWWGKWYLCC